MKKMIIRAAACLTLAAVICACQSMNSSGEAAAKSGGDQKDLFQLAAAGDVETAAALINSGVSLTETNEYGETILFEAARSGNIAVTGMLLLEGADPAAVNVFGETPLHIAAANNRPAVAALLSAWGAEQIKDGFGLTPLEAAGENGFSGFIDDYSICLAGMENVRADVQRYKNDLAAAGVYFYYRVFPAETAAAEEQWTNYVARSTRERLEQWLALDDYSLPPEVPEPESPPPVLLTQEEWETNIEFEQRVAEAQQARQKIIYDLQEKYQKLVETRNWEIERLKEIQAKRMLQLSDYRSAFATFTMEEIFADVDFEDVSLDKTTGDLYIENAGYGGSRIGSYKVAVAEKDLRQAAFQSPDDLEIVIVTFADGAGGFGIKGLDVSYNEKNYSAFPAKELEGEQSLLVASVDDVAEYAVPQEQSLRFIDRNAVGEITYKDGSKVLTGFDDDLSPRIASLPDAPPDNKKWAFVIGAEDYMNTDDIIYARRSAELFALMAHKVLGVPKSHLVTLYDNEATGGNIKGKLRKLLDQGLAEGDILYFYYNGHGVPNPEQGRTPYILPTDINIDYIGEEPFFDLRNLYILFESSKASEVLVFMDSCFTGKTDGRSVYQGKAAPRLAPSKIDLANAGNVAVISAGTDTQFSSAWPEKGHRLFSYYLIDTLASGVDSVDDLYSVVADKVGRTSREIGGALSFQDPTMQGNGSMEF